MEGSDRIFIIPVYQRNYDWEIKHCKQLLKDLKSIYEQGIKNYFLGSIVSIDVGRDKILIIDGQQRLTTLSLLLLAIYKLLDSGEIKAKLKKEKIIEDYLINKYSEDETKKIKLKPIKNDAKNFKSLFDDDNQENDGSNILNNYLFFKEELRKLDLDKIFEAVNQLVIVDIELKKGEDNPQLIFESLNSTGLPLSEADKIRNFILMNVDDETKQEEYYDKYWIKIEKNACFQTSDFIRDFLIYRTRKMPNKNKVYFDFKDFYRKDIKNDKEKLLQDLLRFSKYYNYILEPENFENKNISLLLRELKDFKITVFNPVLLELFEDFLKEKILSESDLKAILKLSIAYIVRRAVCKVQTNQLNKVFLNLLGEVKKQEDYSSKNYLDILEYRYSTKKSSSRFPDDEELKEKLLEENISSKIKSYFLEKLENHNNKEKVRIDDGIQIEHIMPKNLNRDWKKELGENWKEIHNKYLNNLGNLTLTGHNQSMGNSSFTRKKNRGYFDSRLFLNQSLKSLDTFGEAEIKNRAKELIKRAKKVWSYPQSNYKPIAKSKEQNRYSLEDDEDFTNEKVTSFFIHNLMDEPKRTHSWRHFYAEAIEFLLYCDFGYIKKFQKHIDIGTEEKREKYSKGVRYKKINSTPKTFLQVAPFAAQAILDNLKNIIKETEIELADFEFTIENDND